MTKINKFQATSYPRRNLNNFNSNEYFEEYPFYEKYDENKEYNTDYYDCDYGIGKKRYLLELYIITDNEDSNKFEKYVVAQEQLSRKDMKKLEEYCQCDYCVKSWYDIRKYFTCRCCVGCTQSDFPRQYVINKSREKKYEIENEKSQHEYEIENEKDMENEKLRYEDEIENERLQHENANLS